MACIAVCLLVAGQSDTTLTVLTASRSLDANYVPTSGDTVARGKGINLSKYFKTDMNGNPRPSALPWTIGAFEGPGTGTPSSAPTSTSSPAPTSTPSPAPTSTPLRPRLRHHLRHSTPAASGVNVAFSSERRRCLGLITFSSGFAVNGVNNGVRSGAGWAAGPGGWNDATVQHLNQTGWRLPSAVRRQSTRSTYSRCRTSPVRSAVD